MYSKAINDMQAGTGIYDFVYIEQDIIYSYLANNYLTNLTKLLADNPDLASPDFDFAKFTSFIDNFKDAEGNVYGVPMEAFLKVYLYRKDLFNDPAIQEAFKAAYGYDLAPATTHQQYQDIADFFTKYGEDNGLELWGTTVQGNTGHSSSFYEFCREHCPYLWRLQLGHQLRRTGRRPSENGGADEQRQGQGTRLAFWVGLLTDAPPEATASTWDEVAASFAAGRAAQGWVYGENAAWIATDPERSKVVGNVGVAHAASRRRRAGRRQVWRGLRRLLRRRRLRLAGVVEEPAVHAAVAAVHRPGIGAGRTGRLPAPASSWNRPTTIPRCKEVDAKTDNYYTFMQEQGPLFRGAPPFPFHAAHPLSRRAVHLEGAGRRNHP